VKPFNNFLRLLLDRSPQNTLDEMALAEQDEFEKVGDVYRWKKHYRFQTR